MNTGARELAPVLLRAAAVLRAAVVMLAAGLIGARAAPTQGVTPTEVVVGTHLDLTGPLASLGAGVRNGLMSAFDEINSQRGVNGRKLRLIVMDDGYSARKAVADTKTLLLRDHIFAMLCPVGTPPVAKTMPLVLNNGTLHLFPFTSADDTYVPMQALEFAIDLPAARQASVALDAILTSHGRLKVGVLYRGDAMGRAILKGAFDALAKRGYLPVGAAAYTPGATNFKRPIENLRRSGAELVMIGGVAQEAIAAMHQAAAENWVPVFACGTACYVPELPTLGGRVVSGLYAVATTPIPYPDDNDVTVRNWVHRYEERFGTVATAQAFRAYLDARVFAEALRRAGPEPTERRVAHALEAMSPWVDPVYGGVPVDFTPRDHIGLHAGVLAQVRRGRWATLAEEPLARRRTR